MVPFQNPSIYVNGLRIDEPITVLTDLLVVTVCVFAYIKTKSNNQAKEVTLYRWFLLITGVSTFISAIIGHAFLYQFGFNAKIYGWVTGIVSIVLAQLAALYNAREVLGEKKFKLLFWINIIEIVLALVLLFSVFSFVIVEVHSALGLVLTVALLEYINYKQTKSELSKHMMIGVGIAVLAVLCHIFKLAFSVWFNHMDLSHMIIAVAVFVMYKGIASSVLIKSKEEEEESLTIQTSI